MKLVYAALLAIGVFTATFAAAEIDASQADARLIGMPIYTVDGIPIGQVVNIDVYGSNRALVVAVGGFLGFGPRMVLIPLTWANKEEGYIQLLVTSALLTPGRGIGSQ